MILEYHIYLKGATTMFLTECKQAAIYTTEDVYLCDAAVSHIEEDSAILTVNKLNTNQLLTEAHVTFFDSSKGLVTYSCEFTEFQKSMRTANADLLFTRCTAIEQLSVMQRRNDIKVSVNIPVTLSAKIEGKTQSDIAATIWNISAGGIFLTSHQQLRVGDIVDFHFFHPDLPTVPLHAEILRIQEHRHLRKIIGSAAKDTELIGYGCRFSRLPSRAESQIRNYVFRQDLIHRRWISSLD